MFSWFVTRNGRIFTYSTVGILTASVFGAHLSFHGPFLDKYRSVVQMYKNKAPKPVHPDLLLRAEGVLSKCDIDEKCKEKVSFFSTFRLDLFHAGGYNFPWGAIIGLPLTFESNSKINLAELKIVGKEDIDWAIEGLDLLEAVKLSEEAQNFAIAREIYSSNIKEVIENAVIASFCFALPAFMAKHYNKANNTFRYPFSKRFMLYACFYAFGYLIYKCLKDPLKHLDDMNCDKKAAKIGPEYLKGGIEFYTKALERNKELRTLMGGKGKSHFTEEGNLNYIIFTPKLPLTKRLENLQKMLEQQT